jgi:hypothetical protein
VTRRIGSLTGGGIAAAGAVLVLVISWAMLGGEALFSPGALNAVPTGRLVGGVRTHAAITDCRGCHTAPWSAVTMADRCLGCHKDVAEEIRTSRGLHGVLPGRSSMECRECHHEHQGPRGALTLVGASFPHDVTGYSLRGHRRTAAGARVGCADCHTSGLGRFDQTACRACHARRDAAFMRRHLGRFGEECLGCHDGSGAFGHDFDHDRLPFKLTGAHRGVQCDRCHPDTTSLKALRDTPKDCYSCHRRRDAHKGAFGRDCGMCHSTATWDDAKFDHSIFPTDHGSEERKPTCRTCHPIAVPAYTCFGCHAHTPANVVAEHEGQTAAQLQDCIKCHQGGQKGD